MSVPLNSIVSLDLRLSLVNKLQKSLTSQLEISFQQVHPSHLNKLAANVSHFRSSLFQDIPLNRINSGKQLEYVSAIAFKLSQLLHQPASRLAEQIVIQINQASEIDHVSNEADQAWQNWIVLAADPGWIRLRLTEPSLAQWLQHLLHAPLTRKLEEMSHNTQLKLNTDQNSPDFFTVLHSHARCCALLYQAQRENLVQLTTTAPQVATNITIAGHLPWLTDPAASLRCQHEQEWHLIGQISDAVSYLSLPTLDLRADQQAIKVACQLSHAFQTFYAACPIWGEVRQQNFAIAQTRLGLVSITQKVLCCLLETKLGQIAPMDL